MRPPPMIFWLRIRLICEVALIGVTTYGGQKQVYSTCRSWYCQIAVVRKLQTFVLLKWTTRYLDSLSSRYLQGFWLLAEELIPWQTPSASAPGVSSGSCTGTWRKRQSPPTKSDENHLYLKLHLSESVRQLQQNYRSGSFIPEQIQRNWPALEGNRSNYKATCHDRSNTSYLFWYS